MTRTSALSRLAHRPTDATTPAGFGRWFAHVAETLLNGCDFLVAGTPCRLAEVEMYYRGPGHPDPFAHAHPSQHEAGRWYFHRTGGAYRGGSFKGLDLSLGDGTATFGVLFRTIVDGAGNAVVGPSLLVDRVLALTGAASVRELDERIGGRLAWDAKSPLALRPSKQPRHDTIYTTERIGLTLNRVASFPEMPKYLTRPYRYLTEPRRIAKGRRQLVRALHAARKTAAEIHALTGVRPGIIAAWLATESRQ